MTLPAAAGTDCPAPARIGSYGRIQGVDLARAIAVIGMFVVHVGAADQHGLVGRLYTSPHGRASMLFVLIAGVGVSLLTSSRGAVARARISMLWRAVLLLPLGLALQLLDHGVNVILQIYALLFVLAVAVLGLPDRWLLLLAGASLVGGPLGFLWGSAVAPSAFDRAAVALTDPPGEVLHGMVLSGPYPLITWAAPFLFGIWLGRRDLRATRVRVAMIAAGALVGIAATVAARVLTAVVGHATQPGDLRQLAHNVPHGQMPLWLLGATGAATFVLGLALVVADRARRMAWPLTALGQLALTAYVAHLFALHAARDLLPANDIVTAMTVVATSTAIMAMAAVAWRAAFARGPLEVMLHVPWPARAAVRSG